MSDEDRGEMTQALPRWLPGLAVALGVNSSYLAWRNDPSLFYFANVAAHLALGLALAVAAGPRLRRGFLQLSVSMRIAAVLFAGAVAFGLLLMVTGATRPWRWALWTHVVLAAGASLIVLGRVLAGEGRFPALGLVATALVAAAATPALRYYADHVAPNGRPIVNPKEPPASMDGEGAGPQSPFFPSSADTNTGKIIPATFFMTATTCGRCHKDIYDQ